jgi:hypothetical protein
MECFANDTESVADEEYPSREPSPPPAPPPPPPETYRQGNFKVGTLSLKALGDISHITPALSSKYNNESKNNQKKKKMKVKKNIHDNDVKDLSGVILNNAKKRREFLKKKAALARVNSTASAKSAQSNQSAQTAISNLTATTTSWKGELKITVIKHKLKGTITIC